MGEIAYTFHTQPSEFDRMLLREVFSWHQQAVRIADLIAEASQTK